MRIFFNYYKIVQSVNLPISFLFGYIYGLAAFVISFTTLGLFLSVFYFDLYYKNSYYFYFNRGFSKSKLIGISFIVNVLIAAILIAINKSGHK